MGAGLRGIACGAGLRGIACGGGAERYLLWHNHTTSWLHANDF